MVSTPSEKAFVISDVCGQRGGAYRATSLLCEALTELGLTTTCYASWVEPDYLVPGNRWQIVRPLFRHGSRWKLPHRILAWQATKAVLRNTPSLVICVGLTNLCGMLLQGSAASQIYAWELTNAEPGNKFVSNLAVSRLHKCRGVLSPAAVIDKAIQTTYGYTRAIHRIPFWIEPVDFGYLEPPEQFSADFLFLSRRDQDKGLGDLLEAVALLSKTNPGLTIAVAGTGADATWMQLSQKLGITRMVTFISLPTREQAMFVLRNSRFVVLPSWHEGFPISILEAAQRSVPVICTPVGAIPEMLGYDGAALYHEPRNPASLAECMNTAMNMNHETYLACRRSSHKRYEQMSSASTILKNLELLKNTNARETVPTVAAPTCFQELRETACSNTSCNNSL
jgi:glycosyltransferase involved in cell wall biosynthesis